MSERNGHDARPYATEPLRNTWRTPGGHAVTMWYRDGTNDWNTLCSCITEDEYALRGRGDAGSMVDVGGYLGGVGIGWARDHREDRVWIVEPLPANLELIRRNIEDNGLGDRVTLVEAAVDRPGRKRTTIRWDFSEDESGQHHRYVGNSTLQKGSRGREAAVACISLPDLVALAGGSVGLLKIDCEGGEYPFFAAGAKGVGDIVGEYHDGRVLLESLLEPTHVVSATGTDHFGAFTAVAR